MSGPAPGVERVRGATNAHDPDGLVAGFGERYELEMPVHPTRNFVGRAQVRANWTPIFAAVPDLQVCVSRVAVAGDEVWSEWEMSGTRVDGATHLMRGVFITGITDDQIAWGRFYLEPVDDGGGGMDEAVSEILGGG